MKNVKICDSHWRKIIKEGFVKIDNRYITSYNSLFVLANKKECECCIYQRKVRRLEHVLEKNKSKETNEA